MKLGCQIQKTFALHCFRSVVVITCASHAQGPRFEPGRKHVFTCSAWTYVEMFSFSHLNEFWPICQNFLVFVSSIFPKPRKTCWYWKKICFRPGSNRGPCACKAHVITTTLRKLSIWKVLKTMYVHRLCALNCSFWGSKVFVPTLTINAMC